MGEIADDMVEGTTCQLCGCFFGNEQELFTHGFPVVCWDRWDDMKPAERKDYQRASHPTL